MSKKLTVWRVRAGTYSAMYFTEYHAAQMARALELHGMRVTIDTVRVPDDALTRLTVRS